MIYQPNQSQNNLAPALGALFNYLSRSQAAKQSDFQNRAWSGQPAVDTPAPVDFNTMNLTPVGGQAEHFDPFAPAAPAPTAGDTKNYSNSNPAGDGVSKASSLAGIAKAAGSSW